MSKVTQPKRHRYIAKMHQLKFADNDKRLFCFDKDVPQKGISKLSPYYLFVEDNFYTHVDENGNRNTKLESDFAKIESDVAPIIDKIIIAARNGKYEAITTSDIDIFLRYFYFQYKRTPDSLKYHLRKFDANVYLEDVFEKAKDRFPERIDEIVKSDTPKDRSRLIKNATVYAISQPSQPVLDAFKKRGIAAARIICSRSSFVLGSHPIVRMQSNDLRDVNTELWLPIAPDIAVGLGHSDGRILSLEIHDAAAVRRMNIAITSQSRIIAAQSRELVRSLAQHFGHKVN